MSKITSKTTLGEIGPIVCEALQLANLDGFLSGGAVVSICSKIRSDLTT